MRTAIALSIVAGLGCGKHINPQWCASHQDPLCLPADAPRALDAPDGPGSGCVHGSDCLSQVCLPSGTCADPSAVLYAAPAGAGTTCTQAAKCQLATAIGLASDSRGTIVLDAGTYVGPVVITRAMRIVGAGATLDAGGTGPTVHVTAAGGLVELDGLTITGAATTSGIRCDNGVLAAHQVTITSNGVGVTSSCTLAIDRSRITKNSGGALDLATGSIDLRANFIVNNGSDVLATGGNVIIGGGVTGTFAFNTVAYNDAKQNMFPGVQCDSTIAAVGNLVTDNNQRGTFNVSPQVAGTCDFTKSFTPPGAGGNDLKWVDVAASDFHLTAASTPVVDVSGLACTGEVDIDGDARPIGAGCDYGADEL